MQLNAFGGGRESSSILSSQRSLSHLYLICLSLKCRLELADFFYKGPSGKYFWSCRPYGRCHNCFQRQLASYIGSQTEVCQPPVCPAFPPEHGLTSLASWQTCGQWSAALCGPALYIL